MFPDNYRSIWTYLWDVPHKIHWVDAGGIKTRCLEAGPEGAAPVLMLHGLGGSLENFSANVRAYSQEYHVYAIDLVGSGLSDKPEYNYTIPAYIDQILKFMDAVGVEKVSVIGVSLGSWIGLRMALDHPERIDRLISVAVLGMMVDRPAFESYIDAGRKQRMSAVGAPTWENIEKVFEHLILLPENRIKDLVAIRWAIYQKPEMEKSMPRIFTVFEHEESWITEEQAKTLQLPHLMITAPDHPLFFEKMATRLLELCDHAETLPLKGVNHWGQFESPDIFNDVSLRFLRGEKVHVPMG